MYNLNHVHDISKLSNYTFFFFSRLPLRTLQAGSVVTVTFTSFVAVQIFHTLGNRRFPLG